jgi:diaminopimelate epimerase
MGIPFTKMHGLGNDFVIIDERETTYGLTQEALVLLADRRLGVGCDQILFLSGSNDKNATAKYRIVNADGSEAEQCGNGFRCVVRYLEMVNASKETVALDVGGKILGGRSLDECNVRVEMGTPVFEPEKIPYMVSRYSDFYHAKIGELLVEFSAVSIGNPHAVMLVDSVSDALVHQVGPGLQGSGLFPEGVNVGFMEICDTSRIRLRVFERGVGETPACGTGACAAVAIGRRRGLLSASVEVSLPGGIVSIDWEDNGKDSMFMTGPAVKVFDGFLES